MYLGTISGSFRKFSSKIRKYVLAFERGGIKILSPRITMIRNTNSDFVYLEHDKNKPIKIIEQTHLLNIAHSDFLFVVNVGGYIGSSTLLEIGYAIAFNKLVFTLEDPSDVLLKELVIPRTIDGVKRHLKSTAINEDLDSCKTLPEFQNYMKRKVVERGFDDETEKDTLLLLVEELGELSRIIRLVSGLKVKKESVYEDKVSHLKDEIADVFIYLLTLANQFGIDLEEAFKLKESENAKRTWIAFDPTS